MDVLALEFRRAVKREVTRAQRWNAERQMILQRVQHVADALDRDDEASIHAAVLSFCEFMNRFADSGKFFSPETLSFQPTHATKKQRKK